MIAYFNRFALSITKAQAASGSHQGDCEKDVRALLSYPTITRQFKKIPAADIAAELKEYGAWNFEELLDVEENKLRILWIACSNIVEEQCTT